VAVPQVLVDRVVVGIGAEANVVEGRKGTTLVNDSMITVFLNRETTDITYTMFIGAEGIMERAGAPVDATLGQTPSFQDDRMINTFGRKGDLIVLNARNAGAAAREAGFIIQISEVDDAVLAACAEQLALSGFGIVSPG